MAARIVYTGPVDRFFDYCYGHLQYRSVRFDTERLDVPNYQGNAVVNYTEASVPYTRIIEHKHFEYFGDDVYRLPHTIVSREYPAEWTPGAEPFYPINDAANTALYQRYEALAAAQERVHFGGRLGTYRYMDMDKVIAQAFADASRLLDIPIDTLN